MSILTRISSAAAIGCLLVSSLATAGCGDDNSPKSIPLSELSAANGAAFCKQAVACTLPDPDGAIFAVIAKASPDSCADAFAKNAPGDVAAWVADGKVKYDAAKAAECLNQLATFCLAAGPGPDACEATLTGLVAAGGSCDDDVFCAGDARCDMDSVDGDCPGVCKTLVAIGESCESWDDCSSAAGSAQCDFTTKKCVASTPATKETAAVGEPCGWFGTSEGTREVTCTNGLVCIYDEVESVCTAVLAKGADCSRDGVCELGTVCSQNEAGARCDSISVASKAGDACNENDRSKPIVVCNVFMRLACGDDGKCAAVTGAAGSRCDDFILPCNAGLFCDDGETSACVAVKADAAACDDDEECSSGYCGSGDTCAALVCE